MLDEKLKQVTDEIKSVEAEAKQKWQAFDTLRGELKNADVKDITDPESEAFKKAHDAHTEYGTLADRLAGLKSRQADLFAMTADRGQSFADPAVKAQVQEIKDGMGSFYDLGAKALASDGYRDLEAKGILNDGSRVPIGTVMLAKQNSSAEAKAVLVEGTPQGINSATNAGTLVVPQRVGYYPALERPLMLLDLVTVGQTSSNAVEFVTQTGFTNNAAFTAEATSSTAGGTGVKPESAMAFAVTQAAVRTLAHWIPATRQALADAGQLRTIIEEQLRYGLNYVLDAQMVNGDGTGQNLTGILNTSGISTQARGTDTDVDAIHKAITLIRLQYVEPNAVALHPNNWETIRLAKDSTGQYYYGPPAISGTNSVWGLNVVTGAQFPANSAIVGDFRQAILWLREGIQVLASDSHSDFFVKNLIAVLAELRAAFGVVRPAAFAQVTGLN
jgi:HK97 family phage major capsid protein